MAEIDLDDQVETIQSREDFIEFVIALREDLLINPDGWENITLESYLEALAAWVEGMDGYYLNMGKPIPEQPDWKVLGDILMSASKYE